MGLSRDTKQLQLVVVSFPYKLKAALPIKERWLGMEGEAGSRDMLPQKSQLIPSLVLQHRKGKVGKQVRSCNSCYWEALR